MEHRLEADLFICGIGVQEPYEGHLISVAKCEVEYDKELLRNCIRVKYRLTIESDTEPLDQNYINRVLLEEINLFLQSLSLLLVRPSQLIGYTIRLDGVEVEPKLPPRNAPLGLHNFVALWSHRPKEEIKRYSSVVHKDGWPLLEHLLSEYRMKSDQIKKGIALALRWFAKGSDEMSSLDRLIAYWIAFNALYGNPKRSEQEAVGNYIRENADLPLARSFVERHERLLLRLSSMQVELRRGGKQRGVSQELAPLLKAQTKDYIAMLKIMMLTIYGIRNSLFHGAYDPDSEDSQKLIETADYLLGRILKELIAKKMLGYPLPPTRFVIQEKVGI